MRTYSLARSMFAGLLAVLFFRSTGFTAVNVPQHHNNGTRDGLYIDSAFTPAQAAALQRDLNFNGSIAGNVYAQPLYIEDGPGGKAMVIVVTESNNVYALDALSGVTLWSTNVGPPVPSPGVLPCGNVLPSVGITGTPVVDLPSRALFFDAMIRTSSPKHFIFSLNVDTGALNPGWPVDLEATAQFGSTFFNSLAQGQRGALAVVGANLYVPYGGIAGDCGTYFGWVVGVPLNDPAAVSAWATTANGGGAWAVGGVANDGVDIFVATGNTFGTQGVWGGGEAILRLPASLNLPSGTVNYWAPTNWLSLDSTDTDIGGSGPVLIDVPGATPSQLVAACGKDGNVYLLNRTNLGGITKPLAQLHVVNSSIIQAAASYQTTNGTYLVLNGSSSLYALRIGASNPPTLQSAWTKSQNGEGSPFVTSTDGTHNVIVWGIGAQGDGKLHGFDGDTGAAIFAGGGANEVMSGTRRFNTGIVARGRIYVAGDNKVYAFSMPTPAVSPIVLTDLAVLSGGTFRFSFTNVPGNTFSVFATTDLSAPFGNWINLGSVPEITPGQYQFLDDSPNGTNRFYRVSSP